MTNEELCALIQQGSNTRDYLTELYNHNKGMIAKVCRKYSAYAEFDDLMQEGFFGLVSAAESWDETKGAAFITYAYWHILATITQYINESCSLVRVPAHMRESIMKMKRAQESYYKTHGRAPTTADLARIMQVPESKIMDIINGTLALEPKSTDQAITEDGAVTLGESIEDPHNNIEAVEKAIERQQLRTTLWTIVDALAPDQSRLLHEKYEKNLTAVELAARMGTSPGKCRNIEAKAMRSLRTAHNKKKLLQHYTPNDRAYSISLRYSSFHYFMNNWTSAPEKAVLMSERATE